MVYFINRALPSGFFFTKKSVMSFILDLVERKNEKASSVNLGKISR